MVVPHILRNRQSSSETNIQWDFQPYVSKAETENVDICFKNIVS